MIGTRRTPAGCGCRRRTHNGVAIAVPAGTASPERNGALARADWTECGSATTRPGVAPVAGTFGHRTVPHMTVLDRAPVYRSTGLADLLDDLLRGADVMADTATFARAVTDASTPLDVANGAESACRARGTPP